MMTLCCIVETSQSGILLTICDKCMAQNLKLSPNKSELLQKEVVFSNSTVKEGGISTSDDNVCYIRITSALSTPRCVQFYSF